MPFHPDEAELREEILDHIHIGMSVGEAKKTLERHGFVCRDEAEVDRERSWNESRRAVVIFSKHWPVEGWWDSLWMSHESRVLVSTEAGVVKNVVVHCFLQGT